MTLKHNLKTLLRLAIPHSYNYETPENTPITNYLRDFIEELQQFLDSDEIHSHRITKSTIVKEILGDTKQ